MPLKLEKPGFTLKRFGTKLEGFQVAVEEAWTSVPSSTCPVDTLAKKFSATVKNLQSWSHKKVGHINTQLGLARDVLHQLEIAQDARLLSNQERWLLHQLKRHSLARSSLQRTIARSRSRITWLSEGDGNTALFHLHARHRKRKNFISKLVADDGKVLTSHEEKEQNIFEFYLNLLGDAPHREITVNLEELAIPRHDLSELEVPFFEEEVWKTICSKNLENLEKPIIKTDVMAAMSAIWSRKFGKFYLLNSAYITLLPKKEDALNIREYRPISLVTNKSGAFLCQAGHETVGQPTGGKARSASIT